MNREVSFMGCCGCGSEEKKESTEEKEEEKCCE